MEMFNYKSSSGPIKQSRTQSRYKIPIKSFIVFPNRSSRKQKDMTEFVFFVKLTSFTSYQNVRKYSSVQVMYISLLNVSGSLQIVLKHWTWLQMVMVTFNFDHCSFLWLWTKKVCPFVLWFRFMKWSYRFFFFLQQHPETSRFLRR